VTEADMITVTVHAMTQKRLVAKRGRGTRRVRIKRKGGEDLHTAGQAGPKKKAKKAAAQLPGARTRQAWNGLNCKKTRRVQDRRQDPDEGRVVR